MNSGWMPAVTGLGVVAATTLGGSRLAVAALRWRWWALDPIERWSLSLVLGLAAATLVMTVLAHSGHFTVPIVGLISWATVAVAGASAMVDRAGKRAGRLRPGHGPPRWSPVSRVALGCALLLPLFYLPTVDEPLAVGRDQQLYADFGRKLAREGTLTRGLRVEASSDRELLDSVFVTSGPWKQPIPGTVARPGPDGPVLAPYLPSTLSTWIAVLHWIGGDRMAFALNALVWPLGLLFAFTLARRWLGETNALAACAVLAVLPSTQWSAGLTLTEPLSFAFAVGLVLVAAPVRSLRGFLAVGLVLVAAAAIRIDAILTGLALLAAWIVRAVADPGSWTLRSARRGAVTAALAIAAALAFLALEYPDYLAFNGSQAALLSMATLALVIAGLTGVPQRWRPWFVGVGGRAGRAVLAVLLAGAFGYAATLRPRMRPFALIRNGSGLDGTRDFREDSLPNLAAYVSWPVLALALAGVLVVLAASRRHRPQPLVTCVWLAFVGSAILYLGYPQVSPDHPFAVRRLVPVVIPGAVFFACFAATTLIPRRLREGRSAAGALLALACAPFLLQQPWRAVRLDESAGYLEQLAVLGAGLSGGMTVADPRFAAHAADLAIADGRSVIPINLVDPAAARWIAQRTAGAHAARVLHGPGDLPPDVVLAEGGAAYRLQRTRLLPTHAPPATQSQVEQLDVELNVITAVAPPAAQMFGGAPALGIWETGFFPPAVTPVGAIRWTGGSAELRVPLEEGPYESLKLDLFALDRGARGTAVTVSVDRRVVFREALPAGVSTAVAPIALAAGTRVATVRIDSEAIAPRAVDPSNADERVLGVGVLGIRLLRSGELLDEPIATGIRGFRAQLTGGARSLGERILAADTDQLMLALTVSNRGTAPWPTVREQGRVEGAVQIAGRWYRRGDWERPVADQRWPMQLTLLPGDRTTVAARFAPRDSSGKRLPAGEYRLRVGMVRETVAWFAGEEDPARWLRVRVD